MEIIKLNKGVRLTLRAVIKPIFSSPEQPDITLTMVLNYAVCRLNQETGGVHQNRSYNKLIEIVFNQLFLKFKTQLFALIIKIP